MPSTISSEVQPTQALAAFASSLSFGDLPDATIATVKRMVLDCLGCALAATTLGDGCRETVAVMNALGGTFQSTILGFGTRVAAPNAAFANGALVHALNYDPIGDEIGHIGVVCLAAPLAMAEACGGISGRQFIAASAAACELSARVTAAVTRTGRHPSEKFLAGQLLSYFGAAAAAGRVLGLDAAQMQSALGLSMMQMAGSRQIVLQGDPPAKAIYGAFPNQAGVLAALLAREGLGAQCDVLGPPAGLYAMVYNGEFEQGALTDGLGRAFLLERVEFKPWPTSNKLHPSIEAAITLAERDVPVADIAEIEIVVSDKLHAWCEPIEKRRRPANAAAAANSIPFCVAKALARGNVVLTDFTPEGLQDVAALALAQRTVCRFDNRTTGALIKVSLRDRRQFESHVGSPLGSASRPISYERLIRKFQDCCSHATNHLDQTAVERIAETIHRLDELDDIRQLVSLIHR